MKDSIAFGNEIRDEFRKTKRKKFLYEIVYKVLFIFFGPIL